MTPNVGCIYFIVALPSLLVKVGWCRTSPFKRMRSLTAGATERLHLLGWCDGSRASEGMIHDTLRPHRHTPGSGQEWYRPTDEVLNYLAATISGGLYVEELADLRGKPAELRAWLVGLGAAKAVP